MMVGELTAAETDFTRLPWSRLLAPYSGKVEKLEGKRALIAALKSTLREGVEAFERAGELHMLQYLVRFDGKRGTRLAWMHHGIAQEMYHRGQLATYQRLMDLEPALTKRIRGA